MAVKIKKIITATICKEAYDFVNDWAKENKIDSEEALDEIIMSVRDESLEIKR